MRRRNGTHPRFPIAVDDGATRRTRRRLKRETSPLWRGVRRAGIVLSILVALVTLMGFAAGGVMYVAQKADREDVEALRREQAADRLLERAETASIKADLQYVKATLKEIKARLQ